MSHSLLSARSCSACSSTPPIATLNLRRPAVWIIPAAGRFHAWWPPRVARNALAGVAAGDVGQLALERACEREAVQPFDLGGGGGQGSLPREHGAALAQP